MGIGNYNNDNNNNNNNNINVNNKIVVNVADEEIIPLINANINEKKQKSSSRNECEIILLMVLVVASGALNRVLVKISTEPMSNYAFFLSIFNDAAYLICYGSILLVRYAMGIVTKDSLMFPFRKAPIPTDKPPCKGKIRKTWENFWALKYFIIIGFMEGISNIMLMIANVYVSGIMGSLAGQLVLIFAMPIAVIMLKTRYSWKQILGAVIVLCGSLIAIVPVLFKTTNNGPIGFIILMAFTGLPGSISFTLKELIFRKKKDLDLFVVNTTGSFFQLLWWPASIVVAIALNQTHGEPLLTYMHDGFSCFTGSTPADSIHSCGPMPYPYFIYIINNLIFNISILVLLKRASALQAFMASNTILPVGFFLFLIKWPLIGAATLNSEDVVSLFVILAGIALFRWATLVKERKQ